jgi:Subtilase family
MNKTLLAIFAVILGVYGSTGVQAEDSEQVLKRIGYESSEDGGIRSDKITPVLGEVIDEIERINVSRDNLDESGLEELSTRLVKVDSEGMIEVYIHCNEVGQENLSNLMDLGLETEVINDNLKIIQGWLPHDVIEEASELGFVDKITPPSYGHTRVGSVTAEADSIIGADQARAEFGIDGSGVKVGVISDGVASLGNSQASGDLPSFVQIGDAGSGDEGTALLEIIHDIAPGADLAFHTGNSTMKFIEAVEFFSNNGVDIIVDDIGYLSEPFFQDGSVAQAAANAVKQGKVFVSAAGNDQDRHYQALYMDVDPGDGDSENHDFGAAAGEASTNRMSYLLPAGGEVVVILQWSDAFGGSSNDYDLFLVEPGTTDVIDSSESIQNGNDDPIEIAAVENNGGVSAAFEIVIDKFSGEDQTLEIFFNGNGTLQEFNVPEDAIFGHPAHPDVIAVGATFNGEIDFFSSFGPSSIFFDPVVTVSSLDTGSSLKAATLLETRPKPDISAPNRTSTTVPGFTDFFGTSAAAPVVAAAAALVYQAVEFANLTLASGQTIESAIAARQTPQEILDILMDTATDIGPPGFDNTSGAGIVDAFAAVDEALQGLAGPGSGLGGNPGNGGNGNGGGGCSLLSGAGMSPYSGTVMFNILILLIPAIFVALSFVRRRI